MNNDKTYHVCHGCQMSGMQNCSEFDRCGGDKEYPTKLRKMVEELHDTKIAISIIAEKAFDLGRNYKKKD